MGHGCLYWQIHYKEVAAKCVLPSIPAVIRSFFYNTHKSCFSMFQFLNIRFTKKNISTMFYKILLCLQWIFQKGWKTNKSGHVFGQGRPAVTCTPIICICLCQGYFWCAVRLVKSRFSILAVASNHTVHFKPACSGIVNLINRSDTEPAPSFGFLSLEKLTTLCLLVSFSDPVTLTSSLLHL